MDEMRVSASRPQLLGEITSMVQETVLAFPMNWRPDLKEVRLSTRHCGGQSIFRRHRPAA
jgi:hypothetical protein